MNNNIPNVAPQPLTNQAEFQEAKKLWGAIKEIRQEIAEIKKCLAEQEFLVNKPVHKAELEQKVIKCLEILERQNKANFEGKSSASSIERIITTADLNNIDLEITEDRQTGDYTSISRIICRRYGLINEKSKLIKKKS